MNFHNYAKDLLNMSNCLRRQYACVIVKDGQVISQSYNYSLKGCTSCAREGKEHNQGNYAECRSIHAEQMALINAKEDLRGG